jgi:hypothetical protein
MSWNETVSYGGDMSQNQGQQLASKCINFSLSSRNMNFASLLVTFPALFTGWYANLNLSLDNFLWLAGLDTRSSLLAVLSRHDAVTWLCSYTASINTGIPRYTSNRFTSFLLYEMHKLIPVFQFTSQFSPIRAPSSRKPIAVSVGN